MSIQGFMTSKISTNNTLKRTRTLSADDDEPPDKKPSYHMRDSHAPKTASVTRKQSSQQERSDELELQTAFLDNFKTLKEDMETLEVTNILKEKKILDDHSHAKIVSVKQRRLRVDALIKALYKSMLQGDGGIIDRELKDALIHSGQGAIVELLQKSVDPYKPRTDESKNMLKDFNKTEGAIKYEVEPLKVIDMIVVHRGLNLDKHEEILLAKSRQARVRILCRHLHSLSEDEAWRILKPIKDEYPRFFSNSGQDVLRLSSAAASHSVTSPSQGGEAQRTELRINFIPTVTTDKSAHDHPFMKIREIERKIVEGASANQETYNDLESTLYKECTSELKKLSFSSISLHLDGLSELSVEQLMSFCTNGMARKLVLKLLDEDSKENLMKLDSMKASLQIYVDKEQNGLFGEDCLCTLTSESIERNFDNVVKRIENIEISFIDKVLGSGILTHEQASQLATIKESDEGKKRSEELVEFLQNKNTCQAVLCMLENEIMRGGGVETIRQIKQSKTCKGTESMHGTYQKKESIAGPDLHEHATFLKEEIEPRWFISSLQNRQDQRAKDIVKTIQDSVSRKERIGPFMEFLHKEDDLRWFVEVLNDGDKEYILQELKQFERQDSSHSLYLKIAFMSVHDDIIEDLEPLQLERYLSDSCVEQKEFFESLRDIKTREKRASTFIKQVIHCDRIRETLDAMRYFYSDLVTAVEDILDRGSLCDKYRCPRIRQCLGKSLVSVFKTEIDLFKEDTDIGEITTKERSIPDRKINTMIEKGFEQAKVIKFEENKLWSCSGRRNKCIGFIGSESQCKRALLEAMRARIQKNVEIVKVVGETDVKKLKISSEAKNVIFWDLPEFGTDLFPCETYLEKIDYTRYDNFALLVQHKASLQSYLPVVKKIANFKRKVVIIYTEKGNPRLPMKKGEPVARCSIAANNTENHAVEEVLNSLGTSPTELGCGVTLFLINEDAILNNDYDFEDFERLFSILMSDTSS